MKISGPNYNVASFGQSELISDTHINFQNFPNDPKGLEKVTDDTPRVTSLAGDTQAYFWQNFNVLWASMFSLSFSKLWWNPSYLILIHLKNNQSEVSNAFLSSRNIDIKMVKIVYRNLSGVSKMADRGRITLQSFGLYNLSIVKYCETFYNCHMKQTGHSNVRSRLSPVTQKIIMTIKAGH